MDIKTEIKKCLKANALSFDLILKCLDMKDESLLKHYLDEMVKEKEIKYLPNLELYKLLEKKNVKEYSPLDEELVLRIIKKNPIKLDSLKKSLNVNPKELKAFLDIKCNEGVIAYSQASYTYAYLYKAKLDVKPFGYAFAYVEELDEEFYISEFDLKNAYNGDVCLIYPNGIDEKKRGACVKEVLERSHTYCIGRLVLKGKKYPEYRLESIMRDFPVVVKIERENLNGAYIGAICKANIEYKDNYTITGIIDEVIGNKNDPGIEISEIALEYGFKTAFSEETEEEIKSITDIVLDSEKEGRRDFRDLNIITIDGDDSKDFDDAVYLEKLSNGNYSLGVHIADVSHYVKENTPLDKDAFSRGTSVYLADRVIPMIPHKLSDGICSLNEGVDRLVLSCIMEISPVGKLINYEIVEGIIKNHHRMTYSKVNEILKGNKELIEEYKDIYPMILDMLELSKILRGLRHKKGALEFESEEYKFELNADGSPKCVHKRVQDEAEKLIEDFMLEANQTVSYHMNIMNLPMVYRVHEKPDQEKLHQTINVISNMDVPVKNIQNDIHPKELQSILASIKDNPNHLLINTLLLRSMMKAKYDFSNLGHYGLAMNYYCHFTSPIRRYPDLMVHRLVKNLLLHPKELDRDMKKFIAILPDVCLKTSAAERRSIDCERAVNDMLYAWYMQSHLKEEYLGIVSSITPFGMFVMLQDGVEGLVSFKDMDGYFDFNESNMSCTNGKRTYHLGDKVSIIVINASKETRKIDFMLKEDYEGLL